MSYAIGTFTGLVHTLCQSKALPYSGRNVCDLLVKVAVAMFGMLVVCQIVFTLSKKLTALFTASQFSSVSYDLLVGGGSPANTDDPVTVLLSDSDTVTVADTLGAALKLLTYMRTNSEWQVLASDDGTMVSINAVKGMALENTILNQKLLTQYLPTYIGGQVRSVHRISALVLALTDALKSVGFCHTASLPFANKFDLRLGGAHIQLFVWNYQASPGTSSERSPFNDSTPLHYDFMVSAMQMKLTA